VAAAHREVAGRARVSLEVTAEPEGAVVHVDGHRRCVTPCTVDVPPGDHVVRASAPGTEPASRLVRTEAPTATVTFALEPAEPALAAAQWTERFAGSSEVDSAASLRLLQSALRVNDALLMVQADDEGEATRLRGTIARDGSVVGRAERRAEDREDLADASGSLLVELLEQGQIVEITELWENPWFWVVLGLGVGAAAATTAIVLHEPDVVPQFGFRRETR